MGIDFYEARVLWVRASLPRNKRRLPVFRRPRFERAEFLWTDRALREKRPARTRLTTIPGRCWAAELVSASGPKRAMLAIVGSCLVAISLQSNLVQVMPEELLGKQVPRRAWAMIAIVDLDVRPESMLAFVGSAGHGSMQSVAPSPSSSAALHPQTPGVMRSVLFGQPSRSSMTLSLSLSASHSSSTRLLLQSDPHSQSR